MDTGNENLQKCRFSTLAAPAAILRGDFPVFLIKLAQAVFSFRWQIRQPHGCPVVEAIGNGLGYLHPLVRYHLPMALNIKDPEVDRLADELAARMGHHNKTQAIRDALRAQLSLLEAQYGDRVTHLLDVMRTEIWPLLPAQAPITRVEREQILGLDPEIGA